MLANLRVLFGRLLDIVLLRGGPESLPAVPAMLIVTILINVVVSVAVVALIPAGPAFSLVGMIVSVALPLLWFQVAFTLAKKPERFVQTMIAFFGVNTLFQPAMAPLFAALIPYMQKADPAVPPPAALSLLFLGLVVWIFIVWVRIVHAAFEWPLVAAIVFIIAQNFFFLWVYSAVLTTVSGTG
jgi:hypothetical protein